MEIESHLWIYCCSTKWNVRIEDSWKWRLKEQDQHSCGQDKCKSELKTPENGDWKSTNEVSKGFEEECQNWRLLKMEIESNSSEALFTISRLSQNWRLLKMEIERSHHKPYIFCWRVRIEDSWKWRLKVIMLFNSSIVTPPGQNWRLLKMEIERYTLQLYQTLHCTKSELKTPENGDWKFFGSSESRLSLIVRIEDSWKWRLKVILSVISKLVELRQNWRLLKMEIERPQ